MSPILLSIPAFIIGVVLLWKGSDILVEGTSKTALQLGVSSLVISVVIVGFGTSAPEFAISVGAAIQKNSDISLGNIVGSCIANLLLVLGIASIIRPIKIHKKIVNREMLIVFGTTVTFLVSSYFGLLDDYRWFGGLIFLVFFVIFVIFFVNCAKNERNIQKKIDDNITKKHIVFIIFGIIAVVAGAWILIESSVIVAEFLGIPTFIIALSLVAVGTSVPELVVSSMASYRNESDIAIGNVLGSNVFNILLILGVSALFIPLKATLYLDHLLILLLITVLMFPILYSSEKISRFEGAIMIIFYFGYIWYIFFFHW